MRLTLFQFRDKFHFLTFLKIVYLERHFIFFKCNKKLGTATVNSLKISFCSTNWDGAGNVSAIFNAQLTVDPSLEEKCCLYILENRSEWIFFYDGLLLIYIHRAYILSVTVGCNDAASSFAYRALRDLNPRAGFCHATAHLVTLEKHCNLLTLLL